MKTKFRFVLAAVAALAMVMSCSKERGDGNNPGGDSAKIVNLKITAQMPEEVAGAIATVDITADKAIFDGNKTISIELAEGAVTEDVINLSAKVLADTPVNLHVSFNASGAPHSIFTSYVELGADALAAAELEIDATMSAYHAGLPSCEGSQADPYLIGDKFQLQAMGELCESDAPKYFKLVGDIDADGLLWFPVDGQINLDGNGKTISHLSSALFDELNGSVANLTIADVHITYDETVGILANTANSSACVVKNVNILRDTLTLTATQECYAGLLIGEISSASTVEGCKIMNSSVTVSGNAPFVGGVVGYVHNADANISECIIDDASTLNLKNNAGGVVGVLDGGSVKDCALRCQLVGYSYCGGIVGKMKNGLLDGNKFNGTLTGGYQNTGGLIGEMLDGTVKNCSAASGVTFTAQVKYSIVGGLVGHVINGKIESSHASGRVEAYGRPVGGFIGSAEGNLTIEKSSADIEVVQLRGEDVYGRFVGGFIGEIGTNANVEISNSYVTGSVTSPQTYVGAFVGNIMGVTKVTNCYSKCMMSGSSAYSTTVFAGQVPTAENVTVSGFIGWDISDRKTANVWWYNGPESIAKNKIVTDLEAGSISFEAIKLKWDMTVWDLSEDDPQLR